MLKKFIIFVLAIIITITIYVFSGENKMNYIALGDSLAEGLNPYNQIGYSYADYIHEYMKEHNISKFYTKNFAKSGYTSNDLLNDIKNNKKAIINNKEYNIKKTLRESDLVTISIGANDFSKYIDFDNDMSRVSIVELYSSIDKVFNDIDSVIKEIQKYAKKDILIIGYYNPYPSNRAISTNYTDQVFDYLDNRYQELTDNKHIYYISIYNMMKSHPEYLPNPNDIHPNNDGYIAISRVIIDFLEKNILN